MRIQHNIMAMSAYRNYTNNVAAMKANLEKLSSGYKINRAGDDAAGLAISEKMRAQITGLETAQKNAKDGISLVQTAEGALTEVHDMLNRMVELATQSANGTYDNETDRAQLQKELDQLRTEINRIADSSNFNGIKLLDGSMDGTVNSTTTNYTSGLNNVPILPEVATDPTTEVGTKTVLHVDGSTVDAKTSFKVELHNINLIGANGDTAKVTVGNKELEFTFDNSVTSNTATVGKLKPGAVNASSLGDAIVKAWSNGDGLINGQAFTVTNNNGTLTFTQTNTPTNISEVVAPCKNVKVEFSSNQSEGTFVTVLNAAQKEALAHSDKIVIDGDEYDFTLTATTDSATVMCGDYQVKYDNGKLTVVNTTSTAAPSSVAIGSSLSATRVDEGVSSNGTAAVTAVMTAAIVGGNVQPGDAVSATKITFQGDGFADSITISAASAGVAGSAQVSINGVTYTMEWAVSLGSITLTASETGAKGQQDFVIRVDQEFEKLVSGNSVNVTELKGYTGVTTSTTGTDLTGAKAEYDLSAVSIGKTIEFNGKKFTVTSSVQDTLNEIANYASTAFGDAYKVTVNGTTLCLQSELTPTASALTGAVVIKSGGVAETPLSLTPVSVSSMADGTWNIQTTENIPGAVSGSGVLASTTFKLNSGIVRDKNTLTIGDKTFTFKVGKNSTATGDNVIDLTAFEEGDENLIEEAAVLLSQQSSNVFTIGYDKDNKGVISIHEKANQQIYTNGELSDLQSFDELIYFNSVKDESVTEVTTAKGKSLMLQIGDTAEEFNQLSVNIKDMHTDSMGIGDISIANQEDAAKAVDAIKAAINYVSDVRGTLGATQNRLDHTINNLSVMTENIQDAESTIRDVDVAEEMMAYTKNNILIQSAQAMLAQANQVPQGVLQLLQ